VKGSVVQVFLRTPLYRGRYGDDHGQPLDIDAVEVVGEVLEERSCGLQIRVTALRDERGNEAGTLPFSQIVLPPAKIDHLVLVDP